MRETLRDAFLLPKPAMVASTRVFFVVVDAARRDHVFHGEVRGFVGVDGVRFQLHVGTQAQIVEVGRPAGLLHVRVEVDGERQFEGLCDGAQRARQFGVGGAGVDGAMESMAAFSELWSSVTSLMTCTRDPKVSTCGALSDAQAGDYRFRGSLSLGHARSGAHAEELSMASTVDFAGAFGGRTVWWM